MRRNGYLWTSGVNLDTAVRFADPDFLLECKISAIWRRFPLIFAFLYSECPPYFYFRFVWPTDLESIPHASTPTLIIPTKFKGWYDHPLPSYSVFVCWYVTWPGDLDLWPFDLEYLSYMAGHVANTATKFEDPTTIRSWVTSNNGSHWLPQKNAYAATARAPNHVTRE